MGEILAPFMLWEKLSSKVLHLYTRMRFVSLVKISHCAIAITSLYVNAKRDIHLKMSVYLNTYIRRKIPQ